MKHAFIAPVSYLDMIPESSDFHLLLAHLLENERYCEYYREKSMRGDTIIIDNGAFEFKRPLPADEYRRLIDQSGIEPDVIVAPDYPFQNWKTTVDATIEFVKTYGRYFDVNKTSIMAVPQSEAGDYFGWIKAYSEFSLIEDVEYIGMSILGIPNAFKKLTGTDDISFNRTFASLYLKNNRVINDRLWHHFLGCSAPRELMMMAEIGLAASNDSSTAFWHAINGITFDDTVSGLRGGKIQKEVDFHIPFDSSIIQYIEYNIRYIEAMISGNMNRG